MRWEHRWASLRIDTRRDWEGRAHHQWLNERLAAYSADGWELVSALTLPFAFSELMEGSGSGDFSCEVVLFFKRPVG